MNALAGSAISELEKNTIAHLEVLRADGRDEIKRRIQQRDQYSIQLTIALSAILAAAFAAGKQIIVILAPLITAYFVRLIFTSYRLHELLVHWLKTYIEPELAKLCNTPPNIELETWLANQEKGRRKKIFVWALWGVTVLSMGYLFVQFYWYSKDERLSPLTLALVAVFYALLNVSTTPRSREQNTVIKSDSMGEQH